MFKPMDPDLIRSLIKGQPDVIAHETKEESERFQKLACPMCYESGGCEKRIRAPKVAVGPDGQPMVLVSPFSSGKALPNGYAHCVHCGTDFDPQTGVIMSTEASGIQPVDLDPAAQITIASQPSGPRRG